eukprot:c13639_g1_i1.p1 GENE.c13639_g1_i1~~c13639_g1_i1.p1  ORF type:complete len:195 (+),score=23.04 c13639_g1_i1:163-747(+)
MTSTRLFFLCSPCCSFLQVVIFFVSLNSKLLLVTRYLKSSSELHRRCRTANPLDDQERQAVAGVAEIVAFQLSHVHAARVGFFLRAAARHVKEKEGEEGEEDDLGWTSAWKNCLKLLLQEAARLSVGFRHNWSIFASTTISKLVSTNGERRRSSNCRSKLFCQEQCTCSCRRIGGARCLKVVFRERGRAFKEET